MLITLLICLHTYSISVIEFVVCVYSLRFQLRDRKSRELM